MTIRENVPLAGFTTLGVGGPARYFVEARSTDDVRHSLDLAADHALPLFVLGGGSNLLVADLGFPGIILRMAISGIEEVSGADPAGSAGKSVVLRAGAGEDWDPLVALAVKRGLAGIECLSGIPGTVGGTPVQNVGAYGQEVSQAIARVRAVDRRSGALVEMTGQDCGFTYRTSRFNTVDVGNFIITGVDYALVPEGTPSLAYRDLSEYFAGRTAAPSLSAVREAVREIRHRKAMLLVQDDPDSRSAGSFFKNPIVEEAEFRSVESAAGTPMPRFPAPAGKVKLAAAWLIERAGFTKGYRRGAAAISSKHTLALVNRGGATAGEIVTLAREIRDGVRTRFGITLRPEPVFLGFDETF